MRCGVEEIVVRKVAFGDAQPSSRTLKSIQCARGMRLRARCSHGLSTPPPARKALDRSGATDGTMTMGHGMTSVDVGAEGDATRWDASIGRGGESGSQTTQRGPAPLRFLRATRALAVRPQLKRRPLARPLACPSAARCGRGGRREMAHAALLLVTITPPKPAPPPHTHILNNGIARPPVAPHPL